MKIMADNFTQEGITDSGLSVLSFNDLLDNIQSSMNNIYAPDGDSINFDSETPDGQFTNILTQMGSDLRELAQEIYNSFDPSKCSGVVQDSRYALNYIERAGGTFTIQNIDVTVNKTVTLQGLDANYNNVNASSYTVSDNAGGLWYLIDTVTLTVGTYSLPFRYQNYGLIQPVINTITNQVTIVLGVVSVNNSVAPTTLGRKEETDTEFRTRRERSTQIRGQNNIDALLGQLLELDGVSDASAWINNTNETDETGTPANTVWVIVEGGANSEIAELIYANSAGMQNRGAVSVNVPAVSGRIFNVKFDRANPIPLYIKFDLKATAQLSQENLNEIKTIIADNLIYSLNETAETSKITDISANAITQIGGGGFPLSVQISTDGTNWTNYIPSASLQDKFVVDTTRIAITLQ